jgi:hypothetical protein
MTQLKKAYTPPKPIPRAAGTAARLAPPMVDWTLSFRFLALLAQAPIQSNCSPLAGRPVSSVRWGLWPAK